MEYTNDQTDAAWSGWQAWAAEHGRPALPAAPAAVADYLEARHAGGASPATVRTARAAVAKVHQVSGLGDPTADGLCKDVLRRIGREGRDRGRGQVAGIGWAHAEAAASLASSGSGRLQGLRDAAIIRVMSDTLARISEIAALRCADVEADASGGGTVLIRASKSDQQGEGSTRYVGPATLTAINRYREAAEHSAGPLFRQVRRGGHASAAPLGADSIRAIVRRRAAAIDGIAGRIGGHSLRVGSARELAADGASVAELQQAGGWQSRSASGAATTGGQRQGGRVGLRSRIERCASHQTNTPAASINSSAITCPPGGASPVVAALGGAESIALGD